jgi:hypothetical protein
VAARWLGSGSADPTRLRRTWNPDGGGEEQDQERVTAVRAPQQKRNQSGGGARGRKQTTGDGSEESPHKIEPQNGGALRTLVREEKQPWQRCTRLNRNETTRRRKDLAQRARTAATRFGTGETLAHRLTRPRRRAAGDGSRRQKENGPGPIALLKNQKKDESEPRNQH